MKIREMAYERETEKYTEIHTERKRGGTHNRDTLGVLGVRRTFLAGGTIGPLCPFSTHRLCTVSDLNLQP